MTFRHAAALALLGWYMMIPPVRRTPPDPNDHIDVNAPISEWNLYKGEIRIGVWTQHPSEAAVFPSRQDCEAEVPKARFFARKLWLIVRPTQESGDLVELPWSRGASLPTIRA